MQREVFSGGGKMSQITLRVDGMSCGGCVRNVTGVLKALPGVLEAEVMLDEAEAQVSFDPTLISVEQLRRAIIDAGFDAPA
jgi:copper chaperone